MKIYASKNQSGFTLIEMMIIISIIGILTSIAIPIYQNYLRTSTEKACLHEAKGYANYVFISIQSETIITPPILSRCTQITNATGWIDENNIITATPQYPGIKSVKCFINQGATCMLVP